jgi:hypothetical protein
LRYPVAFTALKETHCRPASAQGGKGALQTRTWRAERDAAVKIFIREAETIGPHRRGWHTDTVTFLLPS